MLKSSSSQPETVSLFWVWEGSKWGLGQSGVPPFSCRWRPAMQCIHLQPSLGERHNHISTVPCQIARRSLDQTCSTRKHGRQFVRCLCRINVICSRCVPPKHPQLTLRAIC